MSSSSTSVAPSPRPHATTGTSHSPARSNGGRNGLNNRRLNSSLRQTTGSVTQTITSAEASSSSRSASPDPLVLRLRGAHDTSRSATTTTRGHRRQITWAEDVIDNEGLGRKSSKVCCIYHKTREFGESSSEDDSSSDSSDDSDAGGSDSPDDGGARMSGNRRGRKAADHGHGHGHGHGHDHGDDCDHGSGSGKGKRKAERKPSPNAYEKMPKYTTKQAK